MKNKKSKEAKEFIEWLGEPYDPEYFDIEGINKRLKSIKPKEIKRAGEVKSTTLEKMKRE